MERPIICVRVLIVWFSPEGVGIKRLARIPSPDKIVNQLAN